MKSIQEQIDEELHYAVSRYGDFTTNHEAMGVLQEEVYELWDAIRTDDNEAIYNEALQVAAVAKKMLIYLDGQDQ